MITRKIVETGKGNEAMKVIYLAAVVWLSMVFKETLKKMLMK